jgi:hypothetical protein
MRVASGHRRERAQLGADGGGRNRDGRSAKSRAPDGPRPGRAGAACRLSSSQQAVSVLDGLEAARSRSSASAEDRQVVLVAEQIAELVERGQAAGPWCRAERLERLQRGAGAPFTARRHAWKARLSPDS